MRPKIKFASIPMGESARLEFPVKTLTLEAAHIDRRRAVERLRSAVQNFARDCDVVCAEWLKEARAADAGSVPQATEARAGGGPVFHFDSRRCPYCGAGYSSAVHVCGSTDTQPKQAPPQGWECPKCGRVMAPGMPQCAACGPKDEPAPKQEAVNQQLADLRERILAAFPGGFAR